MDVYGVFYACGRRWYVFVTLILITAGLCAWQFEAAKPQYSRVEAFLVAAPTPDPGLTTSLNPLSTPTNALAALVQRLNSPDIVAPVAAADPHVTVTAANAQTGSILELSAQGPSPEETARALQAYSTTAQKAFGDLQRRANANPTNYFQLVSLSGGDLVVDYPNRNQSVGIIALGGIVISALLTQFVDVLLLRRARGREETVGAHGEASSRGRDVVAAERASVSRQTERTHEGHRSDHDGHRSDHDGHRSDAENAETEPAVKRA